MKNTAFALVFSLAFATTALAKNEDYKDFYATRFAQLLDRAKTPEDLYKKLPLSEKARELIKKDVDGKPIGDFDKAPVEMDGSQVVVFKASERDVRFSFEKIDEGVLLVDGKKIQISDSKTYLNYKNEILAALDVSKTSRFSFFIGEARAQSRQALGRAIGNWIASRAAAAEYAMTPYNFKFENLDSSTDANLEANISRAFEQDLKEYQGPDGFDPNTTVVDESAGYRPPSFTCTNGKLTMLARVNPNDKGVFVADSQILSATPTGWTYKADAATPAISLDKNFVVTATSQGLAAKKSNFLNHVQNPWRHFPTIAQRCCAKTGCYDAVKRAVQPNFRQRRSEDAGRSSQ